MVADISSVKIRSIGRRHLRIQDQDRGCRHHLHQDQVLWLQTLPSSRSSPTVTDISFVKIKSFGRKNFLHQDLDHREFLCQDRDRRQFLLSRSRFKSPLVANNSVIKIRMEKSLGHINCQESFPKFISYQLGQVFSFLSKGKALVLCSKVLGSRAR